MTKECGCSNGVETSCSSYTCEDIEEPQKVEVYGTTYYIGPCMNWWSVERYCYAIGKKMVSLEELGCSKFLLPVESGSNKCADSMILKELSEKLSENMSEAGSYVWTTSEGSNSCIKYWVGFYSGNIGQNYFRDDFYYQADAVCID